MEKIIENYELKHEIRDSFNNLYSKVKKFINKK